MDRRSLVALFRKQERTLFSDYTLNISERENSEIKAKKTFSYTDTSEKSD